MHYKKHSTNSATLHQHPRVTGRISAPDAPRRPAGLTTWELRRIVADMLG